MQEKTEEANGPSTAPVEESDPFAMFPKPEDNFQVTVRALLPMAGLDGQSKMERQTPGTRDAEDHDASTSVAIYCPTEGLEEKIQALNVISEPWN